jgi:hypothetical protein
MLPLRADVEPFEMQESGLGRGFVSRDLLEATSLSDAIYRVTRNNQVAGHNYQVIVESQAGFIRFECS